MVYSSSRNKLLFCGSLDKLRGRLCMTIIAVRTEDVFFKLLSWTYDCWPLYKAAAVKSVLAPKTIVKSKSNDIQAII